MDLSDEDLHIAAARKLSEKRFSDALASPLGECLYRKLGYRVYDRLRRYRFPVSPA